MWAVLPYGMYSAFFFSSGTQKVLDGKREEENGKSIRN